MSHSATKEYIEFRTTIFQTSEIYFCQNIDNRIMVERSFRITMSMQFRREVNKCTEPRLSFNFFENLI